MAERTPSEILEESIVKTLLYFDIFHYPLTIDEVFQYLQTNHVTEAEVKAGLDRLVDRSMIFKLGSFFSPQDNNHLENRRVMGNKLADQSIGPAKRKARLIASFPFVKSVMISGSLSKGYMDEASDFDFFIITARERLWIARTLLVMYKRIFLFNSHKHFCVNYFVDEDHLEIEEKNLFTATELATLIPVLNKELYSALIDKNQWLASFFPNYKKKSTLIVNSEPQTKIKKILERVINLFFAKNWERLFMRATVHRWQKQYRKNYNKADFDIAFKSKAYVSKNHPNNYQHKIMKLYEAKLIAFSERKNNALV